MIEEILKNDGRGDGVDVGPLARRDVRPCARTIASASRVESRSSHSVTGRPTTRSATRAKSRARRAWRPSLPSALSGNPTTSSVTPSRRASSISASSTGARPVSRDRAPRAGDASMRVSSLRATPTRRSPASMPSTRPRLRTACYLGPRTLTSTRNARGAHDGVMSTRRRLGQPAEPLQIGAGILRRVAEQRAPDALGVDGLCSTPEASERKHHLVPINLQHARHFDFDGRAELQIRRPRCARAPCPPGRCRPGSGTPCQRQPRVSRPVSCSLSAPTSWSNFSSFVLDRQRHLGQRLVGPGLAAAAARSLCRAPSSLASRRAPCGRRRSRLWPDDPCRRCVARWLVIVELVEAVAVEFRDRARARRCYQCPGRSR